MEQRSLRIVTLNTWKGEGNYDWRLQLMARELYTLMPDIICLQEVVRSTDMLIDTGDFLADFLNMQMIYAPARFKKRRIGAYHYNCHSGLAVLCSHEITGHWIEPLPVCDQDPERSALHALIEIEDKLFVITNIHLTHIEGEEQLRLEQLLRVLEGFPPSIHPRHWIMCGDFNLTLNEDHISLIEQATGLALYDCYLAGGGLLPGRTLVNAEDHDGTARIDHILHVSRSKEHPQCSAGRVVLNKPDYEGCYPSDHFGVCVDLSMD